MTRRGGGRILGRGAARRLFGLLTADIKAWRCGAQTSNGAVSVGRLTGTSPIDHAFEEAADGDAPSGSLGLDPGAPVVVEPDAEHGGLGRSHGPLTLTLRVYSTGAEWWQARW